jgi:hypothetical protein
VSRRGSRDHLSCPEVVQPLAAAAGERAQDLVGVLAERGAGRTAPASALSTVIGEPSVVTGPSAGCATEAITNAFAIDSFSLAS